MTSISKPVSKRITYIACLAIAALGLMLPAQVSGQQRVGSDGRALDANQRVGSGGVNQPANQPDFRARNDVVTGNVGGGRAFQGQVNYRAPGEFQGALGSDELFRFRAQSLSSGLDRLNAVQSQRNYTTGGGTAVYRSFTSPAATRQLDTRLTPGADVSFGGYSLYSRDNLIGADRTDRTFLTEQQRRSLGVIEDGQTGALLQLQASPLLGVRRDAYRAPVQRLPSDLMSPDMQEDDTTDDVTPAQPGEDEGEDERSGRIDSREDMRQSSALERSSFQLSGGYGTTEGYADQPARVSAGRLLGQQMRTPLHAERADVTDRATRQRLETLGARLLEARQAEPGEDVYADLLAAVRSRGGADDGDADQADPQAEADDRPEALQNLQRPSDRQIEQAEQRSAQARQQWFGEDQQQPDQAQPDQAQPDQQSQRAQALDDLLTRLDYELPRLRSLAAERNDQLNQQMKSAEDELAAGNYFEAADAYRSVLLAHPGEPLARVGLMHAQLGAGMLRSAGMHLRRLMADHPELMAAKYGDRLLPDAERIEAAQTKLQEMIDSGERGAGAPALLIAYLGYQADAQELVRYGLAEAEATDPRDPLLPVLRRVWLRDKDNAEAPATQPSDTVK